MANETPAEDDRAVGRRTLLQTLAAAGVFGTTVAGTTAAAGQESESDDADLRYVVEQGGDRYEVTPLSGSEPVESFYDLRIPEKYVGENGATDPGEGPYYMSVGTQDLQQPSTSLLFFYDGPNGVSLVVVHDADGDDGGSATWTLSGVPTDAKWLVKDDLYLFESGEEPDTHYDNWNTDGTNHQIDWTWGGTRGDGGVLGYLDQGATFEIDPAFNEQAALYGEHYEGEIDEWQVLSADGSGGVTRSALDLDAPLTVAVGQASTDGDSEDTEFDLSVSPPDAKINVESEGLVPVEIDCPDPSKIDVDSISFGAPDAVDDGDGASPKHHEGHIEDGKCKVHFPVDETDIDTDDAIAKLKGKLKGEDGDDEGSDEDSSFSLTDAINAFDPGDDGDDDDDDEGDKQGKNGQGPPDHANDDKDSGGGKGKGNDEDEDEEGGKDKGKGKGKDKGKGKGKGNGKGN